MDYHYDYDLFDDRDRHRLSLDIYLGIITPKEAVYLLQGGPFEDDFFTLHPQLRDLDPPDDETSPTT